MFGKSVNILEASARDIHALSIVHGQSFENNWSLSAFQSLITGRGMRTTLAKFSRYEKQIAGFVMARFSGLESEVLTLCVSPEFRRNGIAMALMLSLIDNARTIGVSRIFLEVRDNNFAAQKLYESCAFKKVGVRINYYRNGKKRSDAHILQLRL